MAEQTTPLLLKNGKLNVVGDGSVYEYTNDCTIDGKDLYLAGASDNEPAYWKNGVFTCGKKIQTCLGRISKWWWRKIKCTFWRMAREHRRIPLLRGWCENYLPSRRAQWYGRCWQRWCVCGWQNNIWSGCLLEERSDSRTFNRRFRRAAGIAIVGSDVYITGYYMNEESYRYRLFGKMEHSPKSENRAFIRTTLQWVAKDVLDRLVWWRYRGDVWKTETCLPPGCWGSFTLSAYTTSKQKNGDAYILSAELSGTTLLFKNGILQTPLMKPSKANSLPPLTKRWQHTLPWSPCRALRFF